MLKASHTQQRLFFTQCIKTSALTDHLWLLKLLILIQVKGKPSIILFLSSFVRKIVIFLHFLLEIRAQIRQFLFLLIKKISFEHKALEEFQKPFLSAHPVPSTLCQSQMDSQDYIIHHPSNPLLPPQKPMLSTNLKKKNCMKKFYFVFKFNFLKFSKS